MPYADPEAKRRWDRAWEEARRPERVAARRRRRERVREEITRAARRRPCHRCGGTFPVVCMDFDHRPGETKLFTIGLAAGRHSVAAILAEIAKCDVVCSNCHRILTAERASIV